MELQLPVLKPKTIDCSGLPLYDFNCFENKEIIGNGSFGAVFTADWPTPDAAVGKVVLKKMLSEDILEKKTFVKEARILQKLSHNNIVNFKGICNNPFALVLEYVYFDFSPFGVKSKVSSLADFLTVLDGFNCHGFDSPHVISTICKDMAVGLQYLHGNDIAHRDLKPANILVSNRHYCHLQRTEMREVWVKDPLLCKLADFGQSRSKDIQTNSILQSQTRHVNRGTPVYMAPEMLIEDMRLPFASADDLKRADIWSLGMTLFVLLNPCLKYPYYEEIQQFIKENKTPLRALEVLFKSKQVPKEACKYQHKHATDWYSVNKIWLKCVQFEPAKRPKIKDVISMISQDCTASSLNIHLKVSQASNLEQYDRKVAAIVFKGGSVPEDVLDNDGTNACAFLSVKLAHEIHKLREEANRGDKKLWQSICDVAEKVIMEFPRVINPHRNCTEFYDVLSAYMLIRSVSTEIGCYGFSEEILKDDFVFSQQGMSNLVHALSCMISKKFCVAIYTCKPLIFTVGIANDCFFILDTHPVSTDVGGKGTGLLKVFPYVSEESMAFEGVSRWIWQRLVSSGVKNDTSQSLSIMSENMSYVPSPHTHDEGEKRAKSDVSLVDSSGSKVEANLTVERIELSDCSGPEDEFRENKAGKCSERKGMTSVEEGATLCDLTDSGTTDHTVCHKLRDFIESQPRRVQTYEFSTIEDDVDEVHRPLTKKKESQKLNSSDSSSKRFRSSDDETEIHQRRKRRRLHLISSSGSREHQCNSQVSEDVDNYDRVHCEENRSDNTTEELQNEINGHPVFKVSKKGLSTKEALDICIAGKVDASKVCSAVPQGVTQSTVFIIDLNKVDEGDLTTDSNGVYARHSCPTDVVSAQMTNQSRIESVRKSTKGKHTNGNHIYSVQRHYSWHTSSDEFCRIITKVCDQRKEKLGRYAIIQYKVTDKAKELFSRKKHGNVKHHKEGYLRTKPSVLSKIKQYANNTSAKQVITQVQGEAGGVSDVQSVADIPRNRKQVYNQASKIPNRILSRSTGPQKAADFTKLIAKLQTSDFVKDVSFGVRHGKDTTANTFAGKELHIEWLKTFCSGTNPKSQCGIDMTYNCGPFYLTALTFPHPMFVHCDARDKHPTTLAGIMTSASREIGDYEYLAANLKRKGISTLTYGTDGETPLEAGFEKVFPIHGTYSSDTNIHLRCFDHVKTNMSQKLTSLKVPPPKQNEIIRKILGTEYNGKRMMGLVDCSTEEDFERELKVLEQQWPSQFTEWLHTREGRLRPLSESMKKCMLRPVRAAAGLGNPPNKWQNQRAEACNNVIKEEISRQKTDQVTIHELIEHRVVQPHLDELVKAIYQMGEYRLSEEYKHLQVDPLQWSQMTPQQRDARIRKVFGFIPGSSRSDEVVTRKLSIGLADCQLAVHFPSYELKEIWRRAEIILSHYKIIKLANANYCVTEFDSSFTVEFKNQKISCDKSCKSFRDSGGLCPHLLVVAEETGQLKSFIASYTKSANKLGKIINANLPKQLGGKPNQQKKPRRGKNNVSQQPVLLEEDTSDVMVPKPTRYTEYYQNDEPFYVVFTKDYKNATKCIGCTNEFPKRVQISPYDIALLHEERYCYPKKDDQGNIEMVPTHKKKAKRFYCIDKKCILPRHPYFWRGLVDVTPSVQTRLKDSHKDLLYAMLKVRAEEDGSQK